MDQGALHSCSATEGARMVLLPVWPGWACSGLGRWAHQFDVRDSVQPQALWPSTTTPSWSSRATRRKRCAAAASSRCDDLTVRTPVETLRQDVGLLTHLCTPATLWSERQAL